MRPPPLPRRREHPRVHADFPIRVKANSGFVQARARDLSMTGLFVDGPLAADGDIAVRIPLPGLDREVATTCRVRRREQDGVALSFAQIEWDDLLLMARYLAPRL